jgi:hypothetical protein
VSRVTCANITLTVTLSCGGSRDVYLYTVTGVELSGYLPRHLKLRVKTQLSKMRSGKTSIECLTRKVLYLPNLFTGSYVTE